MKRQFLFYAMSLTAIFFVNVASATQTSVPQGVTLQGNILDATGAPEQGLSVLFTVQVLSPSPGNCLLFTEQHTLNMGGSNGNFSFILGQGVRSGTNFENTSTLSQVFNNYGGAFTSLTCASGSSYTPAMGDARNVNLTFNDGLGLHALSQPLVMQTVPFAFNADKLQGYVPANFLNLGTVPTLTQSNVENIFSATNYPLLSALISGQSSQYISIAGNGGLSIPSTATQPQNLTAGQFWFDSSTSTLKFFDGSSVQALGTSTSVNGSAITSGTISGSTAVSTSGNIQTTGSISGYRHNFYDHAGAGPGLIVMQPPANLGSTSYTLTLPPSAGTSGQVLSTNGSGVLGWTSLTSGTVTSVTGTAPVSITGTSSAPVIGVASASTAAAGIVTLATAGGTTIGTVVQATDARLSDSRAPVGNASGDLSGSYPSPSVSKLQGVAISANPALTGQMLRFDGTNWTPNFTSMFDLRSTVTGAQAFNGVGCTTGQTLTWTSTTDNLACSSIAIADSQITYGTQNANLFLASPNGSTGAPAYRAIIAADLPAGGYNTTYFKTGGNAFGAAASVGTTDAFALSLVTAGASRLAITATGNLGAGVASPTAVLQLKAGTTAASTAPLKFTQGSSLTNPEAGAVEFDGNNLYFTDSTSARRTLATLSNSSTYSGATTYSGAVTMSGTGTGLNVTTNETVGGTLAVTGASTLNATTVAANQNLTLASGTGTYTQTYTGTTTSAATVNANSVTTAAAETINANGLTSGSILSLTSTSTAAATNNTGLNIAISGANATAGITRTGVASSVTATGTTGTNTAGSFTASGGTTNIGATISASGGTNNYGLLVPNGSVGIGVASPSSALHLKAGTATAGTSPLKLTAGTNLGSVEAGAVEFDGTYLYFTDTTPARRTLVTPNVATTFTGAITMSGTGTGLNVTTNETVGGTLAVTGASTLNATTVAANQNLSLASGTGTYSQTYTGTSTAPATIAANALTSASILSLTSSSTAAATGNGGLNVAISGANATASITRTGVASSVTATGTTGTNTAGSFTASGGTTNIGATISASGGTNNYGLLVPNGSVGIGNSAPGATLDVTGHIASSGSSAAVSACGTSPTMIGTDTRGTVTIGATAVTCLVTFATPYSSAPNCVTTWNGTASAIGVGVSTTASAMTVTFTAAATSLKFNYHCIQ